MKCVQNFNDFYDDMDKLQPEEKTKVKRHRCSPTHRWTTEETRNFVEDVRKEIKGNPEALEKPTAQRFYENIAKKNRSLCNIQWIVMRSKMRYLKMTYLTAIKWRGQKGAALLQQDGEKSVKEYVEKICPFFDSLDEIYKKRKGGKPAVIVESNDMTSIVKIELEENIDIPSPSSSPQSPSQSPSPSSSPLPSLSPFQLPFSPPSQSSLPSSSGNNNDKAIIKNRSKLKGSQKRKLSFNTGSASLLVAMQEKRLKFEMEKFNWLKEKEKKEMEIEMEKFNWLKEKEKKELENNLEIKKLQIECDERVALARHKMQMETEERVRKYEIDSKTK